MIWSGYNRQFHRHAAEAVREIDDRLRELDARQTAGRSTIAGAAEIRRRRLKALRELLLIERERCDAYAGFARAAR